MKDVNLQLVGLGKTMILTNNAQNPLQTLRALYVESSKLGLVDPPKTSL